MLVSSFRPFSPKISLQPHFSGKGSAELPDRFNGLEDFNQSNLNRKQKLKLRQMLMTMLKKNSKALGFKERFECPRPLNSDTYTVAGGNIVSQDAKDYSAYHCYFRRAPKWMAPINKAIEQMGGKSLGERFIFTGLTDIMTEILQEPVTKYEIDEVANFLRKARKGKLHKLDMRNIRMEKDGYLVFTGEYDKSQGNEFPPLMRQAITDYLNNPNAKREIEKDAQGQETQTLILTPPSGKALEWDRSIWDRVVDEYQGVIPIRIHAPKDGSVVFPGEPVMQVEAEDGFGELAAYFEPRLLQVWASSEAATQARYWVEYYKAMIHYCTNEPLSDRAVTEWAQRMILDFGDRSAKTGDEASFLGKARLLALWTTSTMSGLYRAFKANDENPAGDCSMYSLAHRIVQSYKREGEVYEKLAKFAVFDQEGGVGSFVADCYDYNRAVDEHLVPLALQAAKENKGGVIFARPDSGDAFETILYALKAAENAGLYKTVTARDGRQLKAMTHLKVAQADGISFDKMHEINTKLLEHGYSPVHCVVYGIGGHFADSISRSNFAAAMKLCAVGKEKRAAQKLVKGEPGKESIPGLIKVVRDDKPPVRQANEEGENTFAPYYDATDPEELRGIIYDEVFNKAQQRALYEFDTVKAPDKENLLSEKTRQISQALKDEYLAA